MMAPAAATEREGQGPRKATPTPRAWTPRAMVAAVLLAGPGVAQAHLVTSGLGPFYDGALHVLLSPGDLLGGENGV